MKCSYYKIKICAGALIGLLLLFHYSHSQTNNIISGIPSIKNFTKKEYNAGQQNWSIVQDKRGIMYFANNSGVLEYDGTHWQLIELSNNTNARSLDISGQGVIYVGGQNEIGYLSPSANGKLEYKSLIGKIPLEQRNFDDVWKVFSLKNQVLFQTNSSIYIYQNDSIKVIDTGDDVTYSCKFNNKIYVFTVNNGMQELENLMLKKVEGGLALKHTEVMSVFEFGKNSLIICADKKTYYVFENGQLKKWNPVCKLINNNLIFSGKKLSNDTYALGTVNNGLIIMNSKGECLQNINEQNGLFNTTILNVYEDRSENVWLALDNGIAYIEINSPFRIIDGFKSTPYSSLINNNKLYVATNTGGYSTGLENFTGNFSPLKKINRQAWNVQVIDGHIYMCTHTGAFRVEETGQRKIANNDGYWKFIELIKHPDYVIGGTYHGLSLFKKSKNGLQYLTDIKGYSESSRLIEQDNNGTIWVAHGYKGVYKIVLNDKLDSAASVRHYNAKDGFPSNIFINLYKVNNELVFPAERQIFKYNRWEDKFVIYDGLSSLFDKNEHIAYLKEDKQGNIWYAEDKYMGVLIKQKDGTYKNQKTLFNRLEGLLVSGFENILPIDSQNVLISTQIGLIHYNPLITKNYTQGFYVFVREVRCTSKNDSLLFGGTYDSLQQITNFPVFSYKENALRFLFSATYYEDSDHVLYSYYLNGFDQQWSGWNRKTEKEYTNLPEGTYKFMVKAKNIYNKQSNTSVYQFIISPPWYKTMPAKISFTLIGVALIYLIFRYIISKKEQQFEKRRKIAEQEIIRLKAINLEAEVARKNSEMAKLDSELASSLMLITHKNDLILRTNDKLSRVVKKINVDAQKKLNKLIKNLNTEIDWDKDWEHFRIHFDRVHGNFLDRIKKTYPNTTSKDMELAAYLRMNLSSKEMASLMNITVRSVEGCRHRLRKNLSLDTSINLKDFIMKF